MDNIDIIATDNLQLYIDYCFIEKRDSLLSILNTYPKALRYFKDQDFHEVSADVCEKVLTESDHVIYAALSRLNDLNDLDYIKRYMLINNCVSVYDLFDKPQFELLSWLMENNIGSVREWVYASCVNSDVALFKSLVTNHSIQISTIIDDITTVIDNKVILDMVKDDIRDYNELVFNIHDLDTFKYSVDLYQEHIATEVLLARLIEDGKIPHLHYALDKWCIKVITLYIKRCCLESEHIELVRFMCAKFNIQYSTQDVQKVYSMDYINELVANDLLHGDIDIAVCPELFNSIENIKLLSTIDKAFLDIASAEVSLYSLTKGLYHLDFDEAFTCLWHKHASYHEMLQLCSYYNKDPRLIDINSYSLKANTTAQKVFRYMITL